MRFSSYLDSLRHGLAGLAAAADLFYPPLCLLCRQPPPNPRDRLCVACRGTMWPVPGDHPLLLEALSRLVSGGLVDGFIPLYLFERHGSLQQALHLLKYSGMHSLGVMFGRELGARMQATFDGASADFLIPVPLHSARLRERGYNQSERICAGIREMTGTPILTGTLLRTRNTPSQTALTLHEREANVRGAFRVAKRRESLLRGTSVVLVDDVMTTGATLIGCAGALRAAGAARVIVATVAVADRSE